MAIGTPFINKFSNPASNATDPNSALGSLAVAQRFATVSTSAEAASGSLVEFKKSLGLSYAALNNQAQALQASSQNLNQFGNSLQALPQQVSSFGKTFQSVTGAMQQQLQTHQQINTQYQQLSQQVGNQVQQAKQQQNNINNNGGGGGSSVQSIRATARMVDMFGRPAMQGDKSYQQLNQQYRFDQASTQAQRDLTASKLALGERLAPFTQAKDRFVTGALNSPAGVPLALAAEAAPGIASIARFAASMKMMQGAGGAGGGLLSTIGGTYVGLGSTGLGGTLGGAASAVGRAGVLGLAGVGGVLGGVALGTGLSSAIAGTPVGNFLGSNKNLDNYFNPTKAGADKAYRDDGGASANAKYASVPQAERQKYADSYAKADALLSKIDTLGDKNYHSGGMQDIKRGVKAQLKDVPGYDEKQIDADFNDENNRKNMQGTIQHRQKSYAAGRNDFDGDTRPIMSEVLGSPGFALNLESQQNQIADFKYGQAKDTYLTNRSYNRQIADLSTQSQRTDVGYGYQQQGFALDQTKLDLSGQRSQEDYGTQKEAIGRQLNRSTVDILTSLNDAEQDAGRQRISIVHNALTTETNAYQDFSKTMARAGTQQGYIEQDYQRGSSRLSQTAGRTERDISNNASDGIIGILAPGIASSRAYQIAKLARNTTNAKSDLSQDVQYQQGNLDIAKQRGTTSVGYTKEDASIGYKRTMTQTEWDKQFGLQGVGISVGRAKRDSSKNLGRAQEDASIAGTINDRNQKRAGEDLNISQQQLDLQKAQAATNYQNAMFDNAKDVKRAGEDLSTALETIAHSAATFSRDIDLSIRQQSQGLADQTGGDPGEAEKALRSKLNLPSGNAGSNGVGSVANPYFGGGLVTGSVTSGGSGSNNVSGGYGSGGGYGFGLNPSNNLRGGQVSNANFGAGGGLIEYSAQTQNPSKLYRRGPQMPTLPGGGNYGSNGGGGGGNFTITVSLTGNVGVHGDGTLTNQVAKQIEKGISQAMPGIKTMVAQKIVSTSQSSGFYG